MISLREDDRCLHAALLYDIRTNVNLTCQYWSNHCYPRWMCSVWDGS